MHRYLLGLDLGVNSIGWAAIRLDETGNPCGLLNAGVRIFEPGMDMDENHVKAESRAATRRNMRMIRRQLRRRRQRLSKVRHLLQRHNLLPAEENFAAGIVELDRESAARLKAEGIADDMRRHLLLPYLLRRQALDRLLSPRELGRALYHLAQRRGFLSNRKSKVREDEKEGNVKAGIRELQEKMAAANARTLGEYFAALDPMQSKVRRNYTARALFLREFELICDRQREHITPELEAELRNAIFFQRPMKPASHLVGECQFIPDARRAGWNRPEAQQFRVLQTVNHLTLRDTDLSERRLSAEERNLLVSALMTDGDLTFAAVRKLLKLPRGSRFTIEDGGEKKIPGDRINAKLHEILGNLWDRTTPETREKLLQDLRSFTREEPLAHRLERAYGIPAETAQRLSQYALPEGYCGLSVKAIRRLLPRMIQGESYSEAVNAEFPETFRNSGRTLDQLPPPDQKLRNPLVLRIMVETGKVINAILKEYGKPEKIRVELAREAKNSEKERLRISQRNREQEKRRKQALAEIIADRSLGIASPTASDIEKFLLAEECGWLCPYTGMSISLGTLLGPTPEFDVEHIIPYSRCMDNSFANKTLCHHHENRHVKRNMTPVEAYSGQPEKFDQILFRVGNFKGAAPLVAEKLRRFKMKDSSELEEFTSRMLNDTRYASKLVLRHVGQLYGGSSDADGKLRVEAGTGKLTALVRNVLGFNAFLNTGNRKERTDHRHHAVDAIAIALTSRALVKQVSDYFNDPEGNYKNFRFWENMRRAIDLPAWPGYDPEIRAKLAEMLVSHHTRNRVRGAFHNETIYGKDRGGIRHARKLLESLSAKDLPAIADTGVRRAVEEKLAELGTEKFDVFKDKANLPRLKNGHPVERVRVKITKNTVTVGTGNRERFVDPSNNHHLVIVDLMDEEGNIVGHDGHIVTLIEAARRVRDGEPLIRREYPDIPGKKGKTLHQRYRMVLMKGDIIYTRESDGSEGYRVIKGISQEIRIYYISLNDARKQKDIKAEGELYRPSISSLLERMSGKFLIEPLGRPRRNNA